MMISEHAARRHVLVVEDDFDFAALLRSILVGAGYTVTAAYSCEEAISEVERARPDLITLDIRMPRQSGALLYRKLKTDEDYRDIPVVVVTALTCDDRDMENLIHTFLEPENVPHPEAYLEKPVEAAKLLETVRQVLASRARPHRAGSVS